MKETTSVQLGRQQFIIAADAHTALRHYLAEIEKQPGVQHEVVEEVELRMAELLNERGLGGDKVVLKDDIDFLRSQLGEPGDFKDEDGADGANQDRQPSGEERQSKRFFRDPDEAMFAGVASGLGAYFGIDAWIVRIIFIVLTIAGSGAGVVAYLLLWLLAPEAKTPSDRLKMQGKPVTVDGIKELVERADIAGASQRAGKRAGPVAAQIFEGIAKVVLSVIGSILTFAGAVVSIASVFGGSYLLFHGSRVGTMDFPASAKESWLVMLAAATALIVGLLLMFTGIAMASRKWRLPAWALASLVGILFLTASIGGSLATDVAPGVRDRFRAAHTTQTRQLQEFNRLRVMGDDVAYKFVPDGNYYVELAYIGNAADSKPLTTNTDRGLLTVDARAFAQSNACNGICLYSDRDLTVTIHAPSLDGVRIEGRDNNLSMPANAGQNSIDVEVAPGADNFVDLADTGISKFYIDNVRPCESGEPLVSVPGAFRDMVVNEKNVVDNSQLSGLQSSDDDNVYNCVAAR
jgi:phage shock protein PspC (stress-responsive transcriptional regulator)